jgi:multidrug efflux pump subunit AcrA (membrane-fusion protein)
MTNKLIMGILAGSLLAAACGHEDQVSADEKRTVRAQTEVIELSTITDHFQAPGTIKARISTVLSAKIVGQISALPVHEGDRVRQGQLLVEIDNREAGGQLRRAQAVLAEAQRGLDEADRSIKAADAAGRAAEANRDLAASTLKRYDLLRERHSISPQEYDEVVTRAKAAQLEMERAQESLAAANARRLQIAARIEQAQAEVDTAQVTLGYSKIASPIDGIVSARHADPGMLATPGLPLVSVEDDRSYELEAAVEESRTVGIAIGDTVRIEIDALQGAGLDGKVREIIPSADPATRTYDVKLQITSPLSRQSRLRSGFFGRAVFSAGSRKALLIPESALTRRGQLEGIYIVENDAALLRLVKTGKPYDKRIEILSGLTPGTRIVTTPPADIADGVKIIDDRSSRTTP